MTGAAREIAVVRLHRGRGGAVRLAGHPGTPILLGVEGEAADIVEESEAGLAFEPEEPTALLDAIQRLRSNPTETSAMTQNGPAFVSRHFDRTVLARRYLELLEDVVPGPVEPVAAPEPERIDEPVGSG